MDINLVKEENGLDAVLTVNIKLEDFEEEALKTLKTQKQKIQLPGFRQGKVPLGIAKKYLWEGIVKDELEKSLEKSIDNYLDKSELNIIKPILPIIPDKQIDLKNDKEFEFKYDIGLTDPFEIDTNSLFETLKTYKINIVDADIEKEIDLIRDTYGDHTTPETIENEEGVNVYTEFFELDENGETFEDGINKAISRKLVDLSENFQNALIGKKKNDEVIVKISEIYTDREEFAKELGIEKLEAEDANDDFKLKINSIFKFDKAELNEALYEKATQGKVKTEEEFRAFVIETLESMNKKNAEGLLSDEIYHKLIDEVPMPLPIKFIDRLYEEENKEKNKEKTPEEISHDRKHFDEQIKWSQISKYFIKKYEIQHTEQEVVEESYKYISNMYLQYGIYQTPDDMNGNLKVFLEKPENVAYMIDRVNISKVFDKLISEHEFKIEEISLEDFKELHNKLKHHHHD